jgi:hypothetical protein
MTATAHRIVYTAKTGARCIDRIHGAPDRDSAIALIEANGGEVRYVIRNGKTEKWVDAIDASAAYEWAEQDVIFSR